MLGRILEIALDDSVRNVREWRDPNTGDHVVRMDLHISDAAIMRAGDIGDTEAVLHAVVGPVKSVRDRKVAQVRYDSRPRPRIGAGTIGAARRRR